jgi:hypothetical protein
LNEESKNVSRNSFRYFSHILLGNFWLEGRAMERPRICPNMRL